MKRSIAGIALLYAVLAAGQAAAWGGQGHELVGAIADGLLTRNAKQHVQKDVGSLQMAATWPDCVRNVQGRDKSRLTYRASGEVWCTQFENSDDESAMVDYARRNFDQCVDDDPTRACHLKYHFADMDEHGGVYRYGQAGTNDHDVVHAIHAAIAKLRGQAVPAPFSIKDEREAMLMLAHFVGDLHQPLHVGAVYLDAQGKLIAPSNPPSRSTQTQGGNLLQYAPSGSELHAQWDGILKSWDTDGQAGDRKTQRETMSQAAAGITATSGAFLKWPEIWASDTVKQSQTVFSGLVYGRRQTLKIGRGMKTGWPITSRPDDYTSTREDLQQVQIEKAGKHLAELLNAIWPDR